MARYKFLEGYEFSGCAVRRQNIVSFFGTKWEDKDALEARTTGIFVFYRDRTAETQWTYTEIGMTTGIHGTAVFLPSEQWVFVMDDGEVCVIGQGDRGPEKRITKEKNAFFTNVRAVDNGYAYAVGSSRKVFRRDAKNKWMKLDRGLPSVAHGSDLGFDDIDGFGSSEIYACGGQGDLWVFDGTIWSQIDLPTNAVLEKMCCGKDGMVYILTDQKSFIVGRRQSWQILEQNETHAILEQMVWYDDRVYVSTVDALFEIVNGAFVPSRLRPPKQKSYAKLASGDGVLVVAGANEACMYDGKRWTTILESM